jgi:hypothetical protein
MTTLYDATRPVKSARRFGAGILATRPVYTVDHTAEDAAWWAAESSRMKDARIDRQAAESAALDALTCGLIPPDLAGAIARTSLVGHPA